MSTATEKTIDKNLPNKLTIMRIVLVPVFIIVLWLPMMTKGFVSDLITKLIASVIFIVSAITDFIDGKLARKYNLVSDFGKFMDPLADTFLVIGAFLAMSLIYEGEMRTGLVITIIITVFRELAVSSVRLIAKNADGIVITAAMPGKIKTFSQCIFVPLCLLEDFFFGWIPYIGGTLVLSWICMAVMVFFTIYSGMQYLKAYGKYIF